GRVDMATVGATDMEAAGAADDVLVEAVDTVPQDQPVDTADDAPEDAAVAENRSHDPPAPANTDDGSETGAVDPAEPVEKSSVASEAKEEDKPATDDKPAATSAPDTRDLLLQLRVWKERSSRMEMLLAKQSAKIQEMDETESKLKRLLAMAKRSIDNSKQEITEKDNIIEKLRAEAAKAAKTQQSWKPDTCTRDPRRILNKVAQGNVLWCLVEYASENDDDKYEVGWHRFNSEEEIKRYASRAVGEPLVTPELSLTPHEAEKVRKDLKEEIDRVQEEFRRYRVRAEITRKQKDAELRKMSFSAMTRQAEQISETDLTAELQSARAQIRRLTKDQAEAEERESEWRRKFEKLMKDYEKISGTMGETILAMEWRERYEQAVREKEDLEAKMNEMKLLVDNHGGGGGSSDLQALRHEFAAYRQRALNAVEQKERELHEVQAQYQEHNGGGGSGSNSRTASLRDAVLARTSAGTNRGIGNGAPSLSRMSSSSSLGGFETPNATTQNEYLKNIVYKYMITDQAEGKEHMEKAIATVLNFTPAELTAIQPRTATATATSSMSDLRNKKEVKDARFQKVHNDPRFARSSNRKNKLQIDKRFESLLKDKKFQSTQGKFDKYGRRIDKKENELKKFYRLDNDEDAAEAEEDEEVDGSSSSDDEEAEVAAKPAMGKASAKTKAKQPEDASSSSEDEDAEQDDDEEGEEKSEELTRLEYLNKMARGELGSDSSDSSSDEEDEEMAEEMEEEKEDVPLGEETRRFAILNCDWSRIRAVDILALCQSFAPATGTVKDVTIYPSDYGLEKMKEEEKYGPQGLWDDKKAETKKDESADEEEDKDEEDKEDDKAEKEEEKEEKEDDDSSDDEADEAQDEDYDSDDPLGVKKTVTSEDAEGFDPEKLRKYELQKLKYYYAVVTCDSVKTASVIYENCDQLEYETSSNLLDLRYVPDDMEFKNPPKESCQSVPETYKPAIFATNVLQTTDVKLTWEEANETPYERYQREKKQEKNKKLHEKRAKQKEQEREQKEILKQAKRKGKKGLSEQAKLLREAVADSDDDSDADRNFDMKKIAVNEKAKKLRGKRKVKELKKLDKKSGLQEGFEFDAADPRFSALYQKGSQFQLDPTDPKFKKTEATDAIFSERRKRNEQAATNAKASANSKQNEEQQSTDNGGSSLQAMVKNLKRKAEQQQQGQKRKQKK
ncbi:TPA: hypothetical protein N0F65_003830, partial [Lagenidium giganteum]